MSTLEETSLHRNTPLVLKEGKIIDAFIVFEFIRRLTRPFEKTEAYKLGIIDENGQKIKSPETPAEKNAYTLFDRMVFRLKRMLEKLPFGKTRLASFAAALFLIREQSNTSLEDEDALYETFRDYIDDLEASPTEMKAIAEMARGMGFIVEEPANNAGSGNIAGIGDGTTVVRKKPPVVRRKKNKSNLIPFAQHRKKPD